MLKLATLLFAIVCISLTVVGCDDASDGSVTEQKDDNEPITLKVMYTSEDRFLQPYGGMFQMKYPDIHIDVAPMANIFNSREKYDEILSDFIQTNEPDILLLNPESYEKYAAEGKLLELDTWIHADHFDIENLATPVIETLRAAGGGKLYGLTPQFSSSALFYNKEIFAEYNVPLPVDGMSWEDVFQLAQRVPHDDQLYALDSQSLSLGFSPFSVFSSLIKTYGLTAIDMTQNKITVNTPAWHELLTLAVNTIQSGLFYQPTQRQAHYSSEEELLKSMPFITGNAAMSVSGAGLLSKLNRAEKVLEDGAPDWDLVTAPGDPRERNVSSHYNIMNIFAVSALSKHPREAWELMKFINGPEIARILTATEASFLVTRTSEIPNPGDRHVEALWTLPPASRVVQDIPLPLYNPFWIMARKEIESALEGTQSVDETLESIQKKGEEMLSAFLSGETTVGE